MPFTKEQWERWKREHPEEWEARARKIAESHKGSKLSEAHRRAIARAMRGKKKHREHRLKIAAGVRRAKSASSSKPIHLPSPLWRAPHLPHLRVPKFHAPHFSIPRLRRPYVSKAAGTAAVLLAVAILVGFSLSNLGLFVQPDWTKYWEASKDVLADRSTEFVTSTVIFGQYRPERCEDGIMIHDDNGNNISFEVLDPVYKDEKCAEAEIRWRNIIYSPEKAPISPQYIEPTPADGSVVTGDNITVTVSWSDITVAVVELVNAGSNTTLTENMVVMGGFASYTFSNLSDSVYSFHALVQESGGAVRAADWRVITFVNVVHNKQINETLAPINETEPNRTVETNATLNETLPPSQIEQTEENQSIENDQTTALPEQLPSVLNETNLTTTGSAVLPSTITYHVYWGPKPRTQLSQIMFIEPTPENNSQVSKDWIMVNASTDSTAELAAIEWNQGNESFTEAMAGSEKMWWYKLTNLSDGWWSARVIASYGNITVASESRSWLINTNVSAPKAQANQTFEWLPPTPQEGKIIRRDNIEFKLKLALPADNVELEFNGASIGMKGSGTRWQAKLTNIAPGTYHYRAIADYIVSDERNVTVLQKIKLKGKVFDATDKEGYDWAANASRNEVLIEDTMGTGSGVAYQIGESWASWQLAGLAKSFTAATSNQTNETMLNAASNETGTNETNVNETTEEGKKNKQETVEKIKPAKHKKDGILVAAQPVEVSIDEAQASYDDALPGISVNYIYSPDSLKEIITVDYRTALQPGADELRWSLNYSPDIELETSGVRILNESDEATGDIVFFKSNGNPVFFFTKPFVTDSAGISIDLAYHVWRADNTTWIGIDLPDDWLDNASYPLKIDPSMSSALYNVSDVIALGGGRSQAGSNAVNATFIIGEPVVGYSSSPTGGFVGTACLGFFCSATDVFPPTVGTPIFNVTSPTTFNINIQVNASYSDDQSVDNCVIILSGANSGTYPMTLYNSTTGYNAAGTASGTITSTLADGITTVTVRCTDASGNNGQNSANLQVDTSPPVVFNLTVDDSLASPADQIDLVAGSTRQVVGTATVNDPEGTASFNGTLPSSRFRSTASASVGCTADNNICYVNSSCAWGRVVNSTAQQLTCSFDVWFNAVNSTGLGWLFNVTAIDNVGNTGWGSDTTDVNLLLAVGTPDVIKFGTLTVGLTSSTDVNATIQNFGNFRMDLLLNGTSMTCGSGTIPSTALHYNCSATGFGQNYDTAMSPLFNTPTAGNCTNFDLDKNNTVTTQPPIGPVRNLPWKIKIPPAVSGNCQSLIFFISTAG